MLVASNMEKIVIFVLLICFVFVTKVKRRKKVNFVWLPLQAQKGNKKKLAEEESLIECYTCGLETEDPELDQVSLIPNILKLISSKGG